MSHGHPMAVARLAVAAALVLVASRRDWPWLLPWALIASSPVPALYVLGFLCALPRLLPAGRVPAARSPVRSRDLTPTPTQGTNDQEHEPDRLRQGPGDAGDRCHRSTTAISRRHCRADSVLPVPEVTVQAATTASYAASTAPTSSRSWHRTPIRQLPNLTPAPAHRRVDPQLGYKLGYSCQPDFRDRPPHRRSRSRQGGELHTAPAPRRGRHGPCHIIAAATHPCRGCHGSASPRGHARIGHPVRTLRTHD